VFLIPYPQQPVRIKVELRDYHDKVTAELVHEVDPRDILIRQLQRKKEAPYITLQQAADTTCCIHIAYVAEGYTAEQMDQYLDDCHVAMEALFEHEPFKTLRNRFNVIALCSPSHDSDVSQPGKGIWRNTALASHFDTFYSERYLTTLSIKDLHNSLAGVPYEHIIILANTDNYGGGGIYNSYTLTTAHHSLFRPVVVHEFGHSFAGLADEYYYDDQYSNYYFPDCEPWEPNITTMKEFSSKWEDMLGQNGVSVIEGGGYMSKGVWRACPDCRMKTNTAPGFCPVCRRAIERMIKFYTE
jgi:hypothetical protein